MALTKAMREDMQTIADSLEGNLGEWIDALGDHETADSPEERGQAEERVVNALTDIRDTYELVEKYLTKLEAY